MSDASATRSEWTPIIKLLLVDDDPIFRVGFRLCLADFPDLQVVGEADAEDIALQVLSQQQNRLASTVADPIDLVLLNLDLKSANSSQGGGLALCQRLKAQYPNLPVFLLSAVPDPNLLAMAFQTGAEGYCPKGTAIADLVNAIRQVAAGQPYWDEGMRVIARSLTTQPGSPAPVRISRQTHAVPARFLTNLRANWQWSGIRQIDAALAAVNAQLTSANLSVLNRAVLTGQRRELRAARWLVNRLLATETPQSDEQNVALDRPESDRPLPPTPSPTRSSANSALTPSVSAFALSAVEADDYRTLRATLFDRAFANLQSNLQNLTGVPLEIDILRKDRKRELLHIILRKLEELLDELRFSQVQPPQLTEKQATILQDLWQATITDFFGKYYTLNIDQQNLEVVSTLQQDQDAVQNAILSKIPMVLDLLAALLFQAPIAIDNVAYPIKTPEALERAEILLQNLMVQVACGVVQPLLNRFADVEAIKQGFYDRRLLSTREIERFRNDLSWKYRSEYWFVEPKAIFESQYRLFVLSDRGIQKTTIYAPRNRELTELSGIRYTVTLALETETRSRLGCDRPFAFWAVALFMY